MANMNIFPGCFHCDEVLACFMLQQLPEFADAKIVRTRDNEKLDKCDIVVDVGSKFDPATFRFDHHQKSFNETFSTLRPELTTVYGNIRLSSAGLVYVHYGERVIEAVLKAYKQLDLPKEDLVIIYKKVYDSLISEIDAIDNGVPMFPDGAEPRYTISSHMSSRVGAFNPNWNDTNNLSQDQLFEQAKKYAGKELMDKIFYFATVWWPARAVVRDAINSRFDVHASGDIIELSQHCPWKQHFFELEKEMELNKTIKYAMWHGKENDWRVSGVPISESSFEGRKFLHPEWRGQRDEELAKITGIKDINFVHVTGFIGGAKTREAAIEMAVRSMEA
jgi:uncharacterized UPF0160 family protein